MKKTVLALIFLCFAVLVSVFWPSFSAEASDAKFLFRRGNDFYGQKCYEAAAETFQDLADSGIENGRLYYDIGNCWYRAGDIGRAILWYERARLYIPGDADLDFNLRVAGSEVRDAGGFRSFDIWGIIAFWKNFFSSRNVALIALLLWQLFWIVLGAALVCERKAIIRRRALFILLPAIFFIGASFCDYINCYVISKGIILQKNLAVRSGFSERATELFTLHAGTRVDIKEERDGYYFIKFSRGKIGWVPVKTIGRIQR